MAPTLAADDDDNDIPVPASGTAPAAPAAAPGLRPVTAPTLKDAKADDDQFEIIETDEDGKPLGGAPAAPAGPAPQAAPAQQPEPDEEPDEAARANETPAQGVARSTARRRAQKEGRERTFAENRALKAEIAQMREQMTDLSGKVQGVEPRLSEMDVRYVRSNLDGMTAQLAQVNRDFEDAENAYYDAVQSGDRDQARVAGRKRDELAIKRFQLNAAKDEVQKRLDAVPAAPAANQPRDERQAHAAPRMARLPAVAEGLKAEFLESVPWLNDANASDDAVILRTIDNQVAAAGYDPSTQDYWDELSDRAARYLPHRFEAGNSAPAASAPRAPRQQTQATAPIRRGPAVAAPSAAPQSSNGKTQVHISPARKEAMIQAGIIDNTGRPLDSKRFTKMIKQYADYDRANGVGA